MEILVRVPIRVGDHVDCAGGFLWQHLGSQHRRNPIFVFCFSLIVRRRKAMHDYKRKMKLQKEQVQTHRHALHALTHTGGTAVLLLVLEVLLPCPPEIHCLMIK